MKTVTMNESGKSNKSVRQSVYHRYVDRSLHVALTDCTVYNSLNCNDIFFHILH